MRLPATLLAVALTTPVLAASQFGTRGEAIAMVNAVVADFAKNGAPRTFAEISDKSVAKFHDRDLYPFVYTTKGICAAHGARPVLIGKNLYDLKDQDGKYLIREMIDRSRVAPGWINYKWPNPVTNAIDDKATYFVKLGDDYVVGVGVYGSAR